MTEQPETVLRDIKRLNGRCLGVLSMIGQLHSGSTLGAARVAVGAAAGGDARNVYRFLRSRKNCGSLTAMLLCDVLGFAVPALGAHCVTCTCYEFTAK